MVLALMFGIALMSAVLIMISVRANYACNTLTKPDIKDCNTGTTCLINIPTNSAVAQAVKEFNMIVTDIQDDAGNVSELDCLFEIIKKEKGHFVISRII